jgi:hypothetical protein
MHRLLKLVCLIASIGIPEISEPVSPRPGEVCVYNKALKFLRLPFIKINVLLGPMFHTDLIEKSRHLPEFVRC